ncbi:GUN4 domain-containing protein [Alkalinema sp. FACHB-956]|uniref:GUN4 domain-containing protein n=1 Tax=Alkalinema sp. FACHB-956 TaxID=2692768 RepID=UPI001683C0A0|nr:GUN4 domain-containing protein [Alkalinema sp. FACHB-956]MBD2330116.1 GUN4 domain-containing protein [Alkalinema sp. FACHB-956]
MPEEESSKYLPTTIEKVFELLDTKLVTFGVPGALSFVGITKAKEGQWVEAGWCWAGAVGILIAIKIGKKLAPKLDQLLDWAISKVEGLISKVLLAPQFEGKYLRCQAIDCQAYRSDGVGNFDGLFTPLLEEVFVPLELSPTGMQAGFSPAACEQFVLQREGVLQIWDLLERSKKQPAFRQMAILAWGGYGKTTLLKHIAYCYGNNRKADYQGDRRIPVLLILRKYRDLLNQEKPPNLPDLITQQHIPSLPGVEEDLGLPANWAKEILQQGRAVVMLDGLDEVPKEQRSQVIRWLNQQMRQYGKSVFLVTSRPKAYQEQDAADRLEMSAQIWIRDFNADQRRQFVERWYWCQERYANGGRDTPDVKKQAQEAASDLLAQIEARSELQALAKNPLLLNMIVTFHRRYPGADLPQRRVELYREICQLQLRDRPKARKLETLLWECEAMTILQMVALEMMLAKQERISEAEVLEHLSQHLQTQNEIVSAAAFLKDVVQISELLVEREPEEYEFAHLSFQEYLAAAEILRQHQESLLYEHFEDGWWKPTILLYAGLVKNPSTLLREMLKRGATDLAYICLQETRKQVDAEIRQKLQSSDGKVLEPISLRIGVTSHISLEIQAARYAKLEELLKAGEWEAADQETYRLMITDPSVGKEEGQWFEVEDLQNFSCEALLAIDKLWVDYSKGKFGFSVQKQIWQECGSPMDYSEEWEDFGDRVGWRKKSDWLNYSHLKKNPLNSPEGELPALLWRGVSVRAGGGWGGCVGGGVSSLAQRLVNCSTSQP